MNKDDGFTLVELIVTVVILGILSAVTMIGFSTYLDMNTKTILEAVTTSIEEARYDALSNNNKEVKLVISANGARYNATIYADDDILQEKDIGSTRTDIYTTSNTSSGYSDSHGKWHPAPLAQSKYSLDSFMKYVNHETGSSYTKYDVLSIEESALTIKFNNDGSLKEILRGSTPIKTLDIYKNYTLDYINAFEICGLTGGNSCRTIMLTYETGKPIVTDFEFKQGNMGLNKTDYGVLHESE